MTTRQIQRIRVEHIHVGSRHRHSPNGAVDRLARSMDEIGLRTPITVRIVDEMEIDGEIVEGVPVLVTGATRLAAAKSLIWDHIDCYVDDCDEIDAELWEIDENLCRAELSEAEEAQCLARRKKLWVDRQERDEAAAKTIRTSLSDGRAAGPQHQRQFASETAAVTGQTTRNVQLKVERGEKIAPDVLKAITGTRWDKGVNLDILKKLDHAEQRQTLFRVNNGASPSFEDAYDFIRGGPPVESRKLAAQVAPLSDFETVEKQVSALMSAWNNAGKEARDEFLSRIGRLAA